jgi:transposase InsO family protein
MRTPAAYHARVSSARPTVYDWRHYLAVIHRKGPWRSFEAVEYATLEWVEWFNNKRLLEPIGNIPPAEAEGRYFAMLDEQPMAR